MDVAQTVAIDLTKIRPSHEKKTKRELFLIVIKKVKSNTITLDNVKSRRAK